MEQVLPSTMPRTVRKKPILWPGYLATGLVLNMVVWAAAFCYLKLVAPTYTSYWAIIVLGSSPGLDVSLPNVGRTTVLSREQAPSAFNDPRSAYQFLATNPTILSRAAERVGIPNNEFKTPGITRNTASTILALETEGSTPEEAWEKSLSLHAVIMEEIDSLRNSELDRQQQNVEVTLETARQRLNQAQKRLSDHQASTSYSSPEQIHNISVSIEQMRRQHAESLSQEQGLQNRLEYLQNEVNTGADNLEEARALQAYEPYQTQLQAYAVANAELAELSAVLGVQHPQVVQKQTEVDGAIGSLEAQGSLLLQRPVILADLLEIYPLTFDPKIQTTQDTLYRDLVATQAMLEETKGRNQVMQTEIAAMEIRQQQLVQGKFEADSLNLDLQVAEATFSALLASDDFKEESVDSNYPTIQLISEPTLPDPDSPTSPSTIVGLGGGLGGSFLVTAGLVLLWVERRNALEQTSQAL